MVGNQNPVMLLLIFEYESKSTTGVSPVKTILNGFDVSLGFCRIISNIFMAIHWLLYWYFSQHVYYPEKLLHTMDLHYHTKWHETLHYYWML